MIDQIDISAAMVYDSPKDIAKWAIVADIDSIIMTGGVGIRINSAALKNWPNYTPPGWDGPLQFTVWLVIKYNGSIFTSGIVQMWKERQDQDPRSIPPILTDYNSNYCYDQRWGEMEHYIPRAGDIVGFFLSAGNARGVQTVTSVRERTSVFALPLPINDSGTFSTSSQPPIIIPPTPPNDIGYEGMGGDKVYDAIGKQLIADYGSFNRQLDDQSGRWFGRVTFDYIKGSLTMEQSIAKHRAEWMEALTAAGKQ